MCKGGRWTEGDRRLECAAVLGTNVSCDSARLWRRSSRADQLGCVYVLPLLEGSAAMTLVLGALLLGAPTLPCSMFTAFTSTKCNGVPVLLGRALHPVS